MSGFPEALALVLRFEGGYANNPADPGGATMHGITQAVYDAWRQAHGQTPAPVRGISDADVAAIYQARYWEAARCPAEAWPVSVVLFDAAVQHGVERALALRADSAPEFIWRRLAFYRQIAQRRPASLQFLPGWLWRMSELRRAILPTLQEAA